MEGEGPDEAGAYRWASGVRRREWLTLLAGALGALPGFPRPAVSDAQGSEPSPTTAPVSLFEFEPLARQRLPPAVWDYIAQGAADEITLRRNREAFDTMRLQPRVLASVLSTRLGLNSECPFFPRRSL